MSETPTELSTVRAEPGLVHSHCANCGAELHGAYCHDCGQPVKHLMRHLPALGADALDLVFNIDGRIMHTLPALYLRPGFLSNEYFAGRRARYIPPFRLMFFLSVLAFVVIQLNLNIGGLNINIAGPSGEFAGDDTPAQVQKDLDERLAKLDQAKAKAGSLGAIGIEQGERQLRLGAEARRRELKDGPAVAATAALPSLADSGAAKAWERRIAAAPDLEQTRRLTHQAVAQLDTALAAPQLPEATRRQLQDSRNRMFQAAGRRLDELQEKPAGSRTDDEPLSGIDTVHLRWLPAGLKARLDAAIVRMRSNLKNMRTDPATRARVVAGLFGVLPQTMFVLLPLFAVLLKITYLFRRRLYMEHLIVAFHSHAFIFLSLLLLGLLALLKSWVAPLGAWTATPLHWLEVAAWIWLPVYLLLMQKRVYRQGWTLTVLKYAFVGICYSVMLSLALAAATVISLAA